MAFHFLDKALHGNSAPGGGVFGFLDNARKYGPQSAVEAVPKVAKPIARVGGQLASSAGKVATIPYNAERAVQGKFTGNEVANDAATAQLHQGFSTAREFAQAIPSGAGALVAGVQGKQEFKPTNRVFSFLAGDQSTPTPYGVYGAQREHGKGVIPALGLGILTAGLESPVGPGKIVKSGAILTSLMKSNTKETAFKSLLNAGVDEARARSIAPAVAHTSDPNIIKNIIDNAHTPPPSPADIAAARTPVRPPEEPAGQGVLPKKPSVIQRAGLSVTGEISKQGEAGKKIAQGIGEIRNYSEPAQAQFVKKIPTVLDLKDHEFHDFHDALAAADEGRSINVSPKVKQAVREWQNNIPSIHQEAISTGMNVGDLGPNYFPRSYTELLNSEEGRQIAAQHLVNTKQAETLGEAQMMLENMKARYNTPFGHFEKSRLTDLPGYDISKDAIINYVEGAFNKIGAARQFGPRNEGLAPLLTQIGKEGHDTGRTLDNIQVALGLKQYNAPVKEAVSGAVRSYERWSKLGLSSIINASQSTNTASVSGILGTAKDALSLLSPAQREYVHDTGVVVDSVLNNLKEGQGLIAGKKATTRVGKAGQAVINKTTAPGFALVEKFNRSVAAVAGKRYGNKLAERAAKGNSKAETVLREKLGVEGDIGPKLTPKQEIQASRKMVEITQFKVDPQDLPNWTNSPEGKMVAQFRTFSYKQTGFIYNELIKEAIQNKNPLPLARFLATGVVVGTATGTVRNTLRLQEGSAVRGNQEDGSGNDLFHKSMEGLANVGAFGLGPTEAKFLVQNRKSDRFPQYLAGTVGGPAAGDIAGTAIDVSKAFKGDFKPLERRGLKNIPVAGTAASNKLIPYDGITKDEGQTLAKLKQQGASQQQIDNYKSYFQVKAPPGHDKVQSQIDKALLSNDYDKAYNLAKDYNSKVEKTYKKWFDRYGGDVPDDLWSRYTGHYFNPDGFDARLEKLQTPLLQR